MLSTAIYFTSTSKEKQEKKKVGRKKNDGRKRGEMRILNETKTEKKINKSCKI